MALLGLGSEITSNPPLAPSEGIERVLIPLAAYVSVSLGLMLPFTADHVHVEPLTASVQESE